MAEYNILNCRKTKEKLKNLAILGQNRRPLNCCHGAKIQREGPEIYLGNAYEPNHGNSNVVVCKREPAFLWREQPVQ